MEYTSNPISEPLQLRRTRPLMSEDQETLPLLGGVHRAETVQDASSVGGSHKDRHKSSRIKWVIISILIVFLTAILAFGTAVVRQFPSQDAIEESVVGVSNWQVDKIRVDGWRKGGRLNDEGGDALQMTVMMRYWPNYDEWISDNNTGLTLHDKKLYRSLSEKFVKNMCLAVNNATTYDGNQTSDNILGSVQIKDTFCVDLRNNVSSHLNLTLLVEPQMDRIIGVLKKIWRHDYDKLKISSRVDLSLSKRMFLLPKGWSIPLGRLRSLQIDWKKFLNWDSLKSTISHLRHRFSSIIIQDFLVRDSTNGFHLDMTTEPISFDEILGFLEFPKDQVLPFIDWEIRLADCDDSFTIDLPNVFCFTHSARVDKRLDSDISLRASADIEGSLPGRLLSHVCWSDEENALTPMTLLLNKVLNASEMLTVEVRGRAVNSTENNNDSIVTYDVLKLALDEMSFFPITTNFTVDSADLIQSVTISSLKAKWIRGIFGKKRLSVTGTFIGTIAIPFYESSKDQISVEYMKGVTKLFHQEVHFLTVPMSYWSKANSEIYRDEHNKTTLMELSVEVRDDEVDVVNNFELTKVLNEVFFRGETAVHLESVLDLLVASPVGEMVLMGLKGEGNATLRS